MPTFVHGKDGYLSIGGTAITDITTDAGHTRSADTAETSVMGTDDKTYIPGMKDGQLTATCRFDRTTDGTLEALLGTQVAVEYGPEGNTTGDRKYSFNAIMTQYDVQGSTADVVSVNISLQRTGATTTGAFA